jgi:hypothetical protein
VTLKQNVFATPVRREDFLSFLIKNGCLTTVKFEHPGIA